VNELKPKWFVWENVQGVLTSNGGETFKVILDEMVKCGYGVCWRVLDARCFGLPQSRKRLYVVGRLGRKCPPEVLFEQADVQNTTEKYARRGKDYPKKHRDLDVVPICLRGRQTGTVMEFMSYFGCLRASGGFARNYVWDGSVVRVLTPSECEKLQGMSGTHTDVDGATDMKRWKAIGNSMAVPVIKWIGNRIKMLENKIS
jgi:DNA (cytosine-5)-methyltransferase 1